MKDQAEDMEKERKFSLHQTEQSYQHRADQNSQLDSKGKAMNDAKYLDRPIQKLVRLVEA